MKKKVFSLLTLLVALVATMSAQRPERLQEDYLASLNPLNPLEYGLREAKDGKERYEVLYACHKEAVETHRPISYAGIDTIRLDIPDSARSLPLPYITDFAGTVLFVSNNSSKDITLFVLGGDANATTFEPSRQMIDSGDFSSIPELQFGDYIVIVNDKNPWTERIGYGYKCYRADLLYVSNGHSLNLPITGYSNPAADPKCSFLPVNNELKSMGNITIHRVRGSAHKTYCFRVSNQNNVRLHNIHITTPKSKMIADAAISLSNSANCLLEDIIVDSTYSVPGGYGYAISMNNVWNTSFVRVKADAAWGVVGTNNVSNTTLKQCDLNRFDIHCYGRDVHCVNSIFRGKQTQFSSMYGTVVFDSCHFIDCIPVRVRSSYNAYTPFDIIFRHCVFDATLRYHALVNVMLLATEPNPRPEISDRCWPNIYIEDLTVNLPFLTRRLDIIDPTGTMSECNKPVDYLSNIEINGLRTLRRGRNEYCDLFFTRHRFQTSGLFRIDMKDVNINGGRIINMINDR